MTSLLIVFLLSSITVSSSIRNVAWSHTSGFIHPSRRNLYQAYGIQSVRENVPMLYSSSRYSEITKNVVVNDDDDIETVPLNEDKEDEEDQFLTEQHHLRFSGVGRLYHNPETNTPTENHITIIEKLNKATVAVVGLGGVGSWAAEALCRSGIGNIVLIDMDDICISNTNRQLHALSSTVGRSKIHEMKARLNDINPHCNTTALFQFITTENVHSILHSLLPNLTIVLDAIDGKTEKTALIHACSHHSIPILTCGGAAGRTDPTQITFDDITKANRDRLLFSVRKELRQGFGFPKGPMQYQTNTHKVKKWNIGAVFSTESQQNVVQDDDDVVVGVGSFRRCDGALGTACFVTGTYGFVAAGKVVEMIAKDELVVPWKPKS